MSAWQLLLAVATWLWWLVPPALVFIVVSRILRHSLSLYGRPILIDRARREYRFVLQDNEDVPLDGPLQLRVAIVTRRAVFAAEPPRVYAGATEFHAELNDERREWTFERAQLPAYETWAIDCAVDPSVREVMFSVRQKHPGLSRGAFLSHTTLRVEGDEAAAVGGERTPSAYWALAAIALAAVGYGFPVYYYFDRPAELSGRFLPIDAAAIAVIIGAGFALFHWTRRAAPPIIQGYWNPSHGVDVRMSTVERERTGDGAPPAAGT